MHYKAPFQLFKKTLSSGTKVYYYTIYDNLNRRRQYSTGCKTKSQARIYSKSSSVFKRSRLVNKMLPLNKTLLELYWDIIMDGTKITKIITADTVILKEFIFMFKL